MKERDIKPLIILVMGFTIIMATFWYFYKVSFNVVVDKQIAYLTIGYVSGLSSAVAGYYFGSSFAPKPILKPTTNEKAETKTEEATTDDDELALPLKG